MLADLLRFGGEVDRHPEVGVHVATRRHDADDLVWPVVQQRTLADDRGIGTESAHPQRVSEDDEWRGARAVVSRLERATENGPLAEDIEEVRGHRTRGHRRGFAAAGQRETGIGEHRHAVEGARPASPRDVFVRGDVAVVRPASLLEQEVEPIGIAKWQRAKQNRVDQREYDAVGADAECERHDRGRRERRRTGQRANREPDVLPEAAHRETSRLGTCGASDGGWGMQSSVRLHASPNPLPTNRLAHADAPTHRVSGCSLVGRYV